MKIKYIILIKNTYSNTIVDELFGSKKYVYRYRSNYEYVETTYERKYAKSYSSFKAAENAAQHIINIYKQFSGYEIIPIKII